MAVSNHPPHSKNDSHDSEDYQIAFRKHVFQLLKWGYERLDTLQYRHSQEEDITGDLVREIDEVVQNRSYPAWVERYSVHEEKPVTRSDRKGKKRQRLDVEIEYVRHGRRPRYPFEAKRLCTKTHAIGVYLGTEGLGEFLSGNYAPEENEAGMLGYVQSDTPEVWSEKARKKFKSHPKLLQACDDGGAWSDTSILPDLDYCYCSCHQRTVLGKPITLYHLFLVFC